MAGPTNVLIPGTLAAAAMTYAWPFATTKGSLVTVAVLYGCVPPPREFVVSTKTNDTASS